MQETLLQDGENALTLEKTAGQWWLELRHLPSGNTRILYFNRKDQAQALFKGMRMADVMRVFDTINPPVLKMYKEQR